MSINITASDQEILACFAIMKQLRPHPKAEDFVSKVRTHLPAEYRLAYVEVDDRPVAVAGYRVTEKLSRGKVLHIDDLVTDEASRSQGHGASLLAWFCAEARALGCGSVHLDTGVEKKAAQRFYERHGMRLSAYHYEIAL